MKNRRGEREGRREGEEEADDKTMTKDSSILLYQTHGDVSFIFA
jgi:hypothetical protein